MLARTAASRGNLFEARIRVAEALTLDPRAVNEQTWSTLIGAHRDADAVAHAMLAVLCMRDPTGRAMRLAPRIIPSHVLRGARRRAG